MGFSRVCLGGQEARLLRLPAAQAPALFLHHNQNSGCSRALPRIPKVCPKRNCLQKAGVVSGGLRKRLSNTLFVRGVSHLLDPGSSPTTGCGGVGLGAQATNTVGGPSGPSHSGVWLMSGTAALHPEGSASGVVRAE